MYFYIVPWSSNSWKFQNDADADADTLRIIVSIQWNNDNENIVLKGGDDLLCYSCNLLNRGNPTPCPGPLIAFPGAQVRTQENMYILYVLYIGTF